MWGRGAGVTEQLQPETAQHGRQPRRRPSGSRAAQRDRTRVAAPPARPQGVPGNPRVAKLPIVVRAVLVGARTVQVGGVVRRCAFQGCASSRPVHRPRARRKQTRHLPRLLASRRQNLRCKSDPTLTLRVYPRVQGCGLGGRGGVPVQVLAGEARSRWADQDNVGELRRVRV
eukprot:3649216-Rhodomonas_salina.4